MDLRRSILNQTDVSLSLARRVASTAAKGSNLVFSPLSIHVVLGLIAAGSSGPTRDQLLCVLKSNSVDDLKSLSSQLVATLLADGGPRLSFANGVWVDRSLRLKPGFKEAVETSYKAASNVADFQNKAAEVAKEVNEWAEKETNGLIKEILPSGSVNNSTMLIFANAIYFKGTWNKNFDTSQTKDDDFYLLNATKVTQPFMTSKKKQYIRAFDDFKVLRLPYAQGQDGRNFSMYIFLPDSLDGLGALIEKMGSEPGFIDSHLPTQEVKVKNFRIPKFKISFGFEASKVLQEMGIVHPFSGGDLTEMVDSEADGKKLYVSNIFHKAFIEVNEEGTEAGAATAAFVMCMMFLMEDELDFVADHPFVFVVREDMTGAVLFFGQVVDPIVR